MKLDLPGLKQAKALYDEVARRGWEENGTQVLLKWYQSQS
jgi:3-hydroxyisobutyrate dehydrogenase